MSKLAKDLFFVLMLIMLLRSGQALLICASLIVPNNGDNALATGFAMLWGQIVYQK